MLNIFYGLSIFSLVASLTSLYYSLESLAYTRSSLKLSKKLIEDLEEARNAMLERNNG